MLDAVEKGLKVLPPRNKYGPGGLKNRGILMREHLMEQEMKMEQKRDKQLQKISKKWKEELKQKEEEKQKLLESTKTERLAKRQKQRENRKRKYEELVKHNEDRMKEKQQKLEDVAKQLAAKDKEMFEATKEQREKWKEEHEAFLQKQKEKLEKEMEAIVKEREELKRVKTEFENQEKETMEKVKGQVMKYFEKNKDKLFIEKKEKEEVAKFIEKPAVKEIFNKYDVPLRYFFEFYSRSEHHKISFELDKNMETMNYKEFIRFGYQSHIVPALLPVDEMTHTFRLLVRERQDESKDEKMQVLDYKYFIKALVRIAALAQDYLGGQKGQKLEKKMEELTKEKEKTQKLKKSIAKKFEKRYNQTDNESEGSLERDKAGEASGNETGRESQRERGDIHKRGAKKPRKKIIKEGFKDTTLKNATILKNVVSEAELLNRKSKNVNTMIKEGTRAEILEHIKKVKVEDKRVTREVDVDLITAVTIEGLLNYLQIQPEDNKYTLDKKLNKVIRYNAGAKPNRLIKSIKPQKADAVDKASSGDEADGDKSPVTPKTKTEKTEQSGSEDEDDDGKSTQK